MIIDIVSEVTLLTGKMQRLPGVVLSESRHGRIDWPNDLSVEEVIEAHFTEKEDPDDRVLWGPHHSEESVVISMRSNYHRKINGKYFKTDDLVRPDHIPNSNTWVKPSSKLIQDKIKKTQRNHSVLVDRYDRDSSKEPDAVSQELDCKMPATWDAYVNKFMKRDDDKEIIVSPSSRTEFAVTGQSYWQKGEETRTCMEKADYHRKKNGKYFITQSPPSEELFDIGYRSNIKGKFIKRMNAEENSIFNHTALDKFRLDKRLEKTWLSRLAFCKPHTKISGEKQKEIEERELESIYEDRDDERLTTAINKEVERDNTKDEYDLLTIRFNRLFEIIDRLNYLDRNGCYFSTSINKLKLELATTTHNCNKRLVELENELEEPLPEGTICPVCGGYADIKGDTAYCDWGCESKVSDAPDLSRSCWPDGNPESVEQTLAKILSS